MDFTGQTPFLTAALAGDVTVMRLLLEARRRSAHPDVRRAPRPLMAAAGVNWVFDQTYDEGPTALLEAVKLCFELGMDVNAVNSMGLTALHGAANRGSDDIIRFLVEKGAKLDVKDKEGRTPLTWAEGVFLATHPGEAEAELDRADQAADGEPAPATAMTASATSRCRARRAGRPSSCAARRSHDRAGPRRRPAGARAASAARSAAPAAAPPTPAFLKQVPAHLPQPAARPAAWRSTRWTSTHVGADAETWEKVVRKISTGMMPPSGAPRPERAALDAFASAARSAARSRRRSPDADLDTPALHRLNRTEYANAIRDLLALDVDVAPLLPADGSSEGFDNIAEALASRRRSSRATCRRR